jgi:hypothetical protein
LTVSDFQQLVAGIDAEMKQIEKANQAAQQRGARRA